MSGERLIAPPKNARLFVVPQEYLAICQRERTRKTRDKATGETRVNTYYEADECAAALLRIFEHWTVWKIKSAGNGEAETPWIWMSKADIQEWELLGAFGEYRIAEALKLLTAKGFLNTRNNPHKGWDRTIQYQFNTQAIQEAVNSLPPFRNITEWRAQYCGMDTAISQNASPNIAEAIPQIPSQTSQQTSTQKKGSAPDPAEATTSHSDSEPPSPALLEAEQPKAESDPPASSETPDEKPPRPPQRHVAIIEAYWAGLPGGKPYDDELGKHLKLAAKAAQDPDFDLDGFKRFMTVVYDPAVDVWDYSKWRNSNIPFKEALNLFKVWWPRHKPKVVVIPAYDRHAVAEHNKAYAAAHAHLWVKDGEA